MNRRAIDRLGRSLREAAAEGFAGVADDALGERLVACVQEADAPELAPLGDALTGFATKGRHERSLAVALGLRLVRGIRPPEPKPVPRAPVSSPEQDPTVLPRVGPSTAAKLAKRGLRTVEDLAYLLPLGYEDRRQIRPLEEVEEGDPALVRGEVVRFRQGRFRGRFMATMVVRHQPPGGGSTEVEARWFHPVGGLGQRGGEGTEVVLVGTLKTFRDRPSMVHPEVYDAATFVPGIAVRYPVVEGVGPKTIARLCVAAVDHLERTRARELDLIPPDIAGARGLPSQIEALRTLHDPGDDPEPEAWEALIQGRSSAHERLAFQEFYLLQLAVLRERAQWRRTPCNFGALPEIGVDREKLRAVLPFEPTGAQWRTISEIEDDMQSGRPMLRLLQGDVGSGKTVVAFAAAMAVIAEGGQAAIMAPTEILAGQHLRTLTAWCELAGIRVALLTGSTPKAERRSLLALLEAGKVDLLVGTHALLVDDVQFARLGLVVVDEQHRFGVEQRSTLRAKGTAPHLLVMTATPIPRTLALTAYGELDVSVLDELPPGREPAQTRLHTGVPGLRKARELLCRSVEKGVQAYLVVPLVEASEALDVTHVEQAAQAIRERMPNVAVTTVHGRMPVAEKEAAMAAFRAGEARVLVATSVIEVGVDVPSARAILVEHAERFGLAQLHQLRGRVGRGQGPSLCLLHAAGGPKSDAAARLKVLVETGDGFLVAERDLALRGPGEVFGTRQSGAPRVRFEARWGLGGEGLKLLVAARDAAAQTLEKDPDLQEHPELQAALHARATDRPVFSADAG